MLFLQMLKFADAMDRQEFIQKLETFLRGIGLSLQKVNFKEEVIKKNATTREQRQKLLDKFFRIVCLQVKKVWSANKFWIYLQCGFVVNC